MSKSHFITLFVFLSLCISTAQAVIVKVDILKGKNPKTGQEQYVYLLGDQHNNGWKVFDFSSKNKEQKNALYKIIEQYPKKEIKVIIENKIGMFCKKRSFLHISEKLVMKIESFFKQSLLYLFGSHCEKLGLDVANVDIRIEMNDDAKTKYYLKNFILGMFAIDSCILLWQKRFARLAFSGLTDYLISKYLDFIMPDIDIKKMHTFRLDEIDKLLNTCNEKEKYLKKYYQGVKERLNSKFDAIYKKYIVPIKNKYSFDALMKNNSFDKSLYWDLMLFDAEIIDAKAIDEIIQSDNKSTLFVFLGAWHTINIKSVLKRLGYHAIFTDMSKKRYKNQWHYDPHNAFNYSTLCRLLSPEYRVTLH